MSSPIWVTGRRCARSCGASASPSTSRSSSCPRSARICRSSASLRCRSPCAWCSSPALKSVSSLRAEDPYPVSLIWKMLFDDFLASYALWLWVPHGASLVRDDGGGFELSSLRAKRSNPWHIRNEGGLLRCARNDGVAALGNSSRLSFRDAPVAQARYP